MTIEMALMWSALGLVAVLQIVIAATAAAYGGGHAGWELARANGNGRHPGDDQRRRRAAGHAVLSLARGLSFGALIAAAALLAILVIQPIEAVIPGPGAQWAGIGAALAIVLGWAAAGYVLFNRLGLASLPRVRAALRTAAAGLEWLAQAPVVNLFALDLHGRNGDSGGRDESTSSVLEENLSMLEAAGLGADEDEFRMIRGILRMDSVKVREIMRPRVDMVMAPVASAPADLAELMAVGGYSKIPVHAENIDDIVGVVYARDLLRAMHDDADASRKTPLKKLVRPAIFVPESQNLEQLLREFQQHRTQLAIVIDEYGGVSGLVTVEDLLEEIVGELVDEFDVEEPELQRVSEAETVVDARLSLDALNRELGVTLPADGFDTVGGLVYRELGKMPVAGDRVEVDGLQITVQSTAGRRIRKLRVVRQAPQHAAQAGQQTTA